MGPRIRLSGSSSSGTSSRPPPSGTSVRPASTPATNCPSSMPSCTTACPAPSIPRWSVTGLARLARTELLLPGSDSADLPVELAAPVDALGAQVGLELLEEPVVHLPTVHKESLKSPLL